MATRSLPRRPAQAEITPAVEHGTSSDDTGELICSVDEALGIVRLVKDALVREAGPNVQLAACFSALAAAWSILDRVRDSLDERQLAEGRKGGAS